ncbi:hypothetical protein NS365_21420, partial [Aureimonas ureilytica]
MLGQSPLSTAALSAAPHAGSAELQARALVAATATYRVNVAANLNARATIIARAGRVQPARASLTGRATSAADADATYAVTAILAAVCALSGGAPMPIRRSPATLTAVALLDVAPRTSFEDLIAGNGRRR